MRLDNARLYLVSGARLGKVAVADVIPELAAAGVDIYQLREKRMEARDLIRLGEPIAAACRSAGIPFIVNDRPDVALALGTVGVHVGQNDLPVEMARHIVGEAIVGLSSHSPDEFDAAIREPVDYVATGPVYETPTKVGRPAAGLELIRHAARGRSTVPWFAIGGISPETLEEVLDAGARRIVVVRAIAEAADPVAAAFRLRSLLDAAPL